MTESKASASQKLYRIFNELKRDHAELRSKYEAIVKRQKN